MTDLTKDTKGRPWAKLSELKAGDKIELDDGFDCHDAGIVEVLSRPDGTLYFDCAEGGHTLTGQADDGEYMIGIYGPIKS